MNLDKAGRAYWEKLWVERPASSTPPSVAHVQKQFQRFFARVFKDFNTRGAKLLEAGCGSVSTLPYFAKQFGFNVTGIDYSQTACDQARAVLNRERVGGDIVCADFFNPPEELKEAFDVVFSSGVAEHFTETSGCIKTLAGFLKSGGLMITSIPNLTGLCGTIQKVVNRPVFDIHVPLDRKALATAHLEAGLDVLDCEYFMSTNFGIVNLHGIKRRFSFAKRAALAMLTRSSHAVWLAEDLLRPIPPNKFSSPYVICVARKRAVANQPDTSSHL